MSMGLSRTMGPSSGSRTSNKNNSKILEQIRVANEFLNNPPTVEEVKNEIDSKMNVLLGMENLYKLFDVIMSMNRDPNDKSSNQTQISALNKLKQYGVKKFILDFDTSNSNSEEYAPKVAYIQTLFNALKTQIPTDEWVVSYETSSPVVETNMVKQIDNEIAKLKPSLFSSLFGRGGRKQKRTKKGRKNSKRKTKRHKKTRSRRR